MTFFLCVCAWLLANLCPSVKAETGVLRFAPPNGLKLIQTIERGVREVNQKTLDAPEETQSKTVTLFSFNRASNGFTVSQVITQSTGTLNGKTFENPGTKLLIGRTNTLVISTSGELVELRGFEHLAEDLKRITPTNLHGFLEKRLSKELFSKEKQLWDLYVKRLIGRTLHEGDSWKETVSFGPGGDGGSGDIQYVSTRILKIGRKENKTLVSMAYAMSTVPGDVDQADLVSGKPEEGDKFIAGKPSQLPSVRTIGWRLFEADTLLPVKDVRMSRGIESGPKGLTIRTEKHIETYQELH